MNWNTGGSKPLHIMFKTGHALLLPGGRFLKPRIGRKTDADQPRHVVYSWPQTRHFHKREQTQDGSRTETSRVREKSAAAFCPCQQSRSQTVRIHRQATASIIRKIAPATRVNCPQTIRSRESSAPANWHDSQFVRKRGLTKNNPRHHLVVSAWASARFLVLIQIIPRHEHV